MCCPVTAVDVIRAATPAGFLTVFVFLFSGGRSVCAGRCPVLFCVASATDLDFLYLLFYAFAMPPLAMFVWTCCLFPGPHGSVIPKVIWRGWSSAYTAVQGYTHICLTIRSRCLLCQRWNHSAAWCASCPVKWTLWRTPDGPHYSQWGLLGAIGVCHVTDLAVFFCYDQKIE